MQLKISKFRRIYGFTLMEIMVVTILIGIIAGFSIPNFTRVLTKGKVRDAVSQLSSIYASNMIIKARTTNFFPSPLTNNLNDINNNLNINIIPNGLTYTYESDGTTFTATAGNTNFTVQMTQAAIDTAIPNPCCVVAETCGKTAAGGLAVCP